MSLFTRRDAYRPFARPWAFEAFKQMFHHMHWDPEEAPLAEDIKDWNEKLTPAEKALLTQLFRFFTQADVDISEGYIDKYLPRFKEHEVRMMLTSFAAAEANHIYAYSLLMDTLGISEGEYAAFLKFAAMRKKHEYMLERQSGKGIADLAVDLAIFSAFGEGMQLFSSFALLMSFQRRKLMKGMTTIVEWSIRDESWHVECMIRLFHDLIEEHPRVWTDETKARIYQACRDMVELEDAFIDQACAFGEVPGFTVVEAKAYIRYIADRRLLQLGLKPNYGQKTNPFEWLDELTGLPIHVNFFEQRATEYSKAALVLSDAAFKFASRGAARNEPVSFAPLTTAFPALFGLSSDPLQA